MKKMEIKRRIAALKDNLNCLAVERTMGLVDSSCYNERKRKIQKRIRELKDEMSKASDVSQSL